MIGKLFRSRKPSPPERPSFRPVLERLESREVPSTAQAVAAFHALPTDVSNLQASLAARPPDVNAINTNYNAVAGDMFILRVSASNFRIDGRLRIDNALLTDGLVLIYSGFLNHGFIPNQQFVNVVQLGGSAVEFGFLDSIEAGLFPFSNGNAILV
jgi:hypothetical protein